MEEGVEKHDGPYGPPGVSPKAAADRLAALRLRQHANPTPLLRTSKASYYLDDDIQEADFMVDPFEMPPFATAEKLLQAYMESCHNTFPFLPKKAFINQFYNCKCFEIVSVMRLVMYWHINQICIQKLISTSFSYLSTCADHFFLNSRLRYSKTRGSRDPFATMASRSQSSFCYRCSVLAPHLR